MSMRIQMWESFNNYIISYLKDTLKTNISLTLYLYLKHDIELGKYNAHPNRGTEVQTAQHKCLHCICLAIMENEVHPTINLKRYST